LDFAYLLVTESMNLSMKLNVESRLEIQWSVHMYWLWKIYV